ncbi:hypothetical protein sos41_14770 [Alphaproteobacteria bacterium SO-S41]|nr:hypothetical protein sos41_14770 [Alphaproteobacteria bacterium SO-S41]
MNIFIYGNCQGLGIQHLINLWADVLGIKCKISVVENYRLINKELKIDDYLNDIYGSDILVYQPVHNYGILSTEGPDSFVNGLKSTVEKISFPYVYNEALWPVFPDGPALNNSSVLDAALSEGRGKDEILREYDAGAFDFNFANRYAHTTKLLRDRESGIDIKLSSFLDEYREEKLFLTQNHPTTRVFSFLAGEILGRLGYASAVQERVGIFDQLPENIVGLPGEWPIGSYSFEHFRFRYMENIDGSASAYYRNLIEQYLSDK